MMSVDATTCTITTTDSPQSQPQSSHPVEKHNTICKFYQNGHCKYSENCGYSHQLNQVSTSTIQSIIKDIDNSDSLTKENETPVANPLRHKCKFFNSSRGCQKGDQCEYLHEKYNRFLQNNSNNKKNDEVKNQREKTDKSNQKKKQTTNKLHQALNRLKSNYSVSYTLNKANTQAEVHLNIVPSDPEFPYQLEQLILQFSLRIDAINNIQNITVTSESVPLKFTLNVELSLRAHNLQNPKQTIFQKLAWLDKNLEDVLSKPGAETIKFVNFKKEDAENTTQESNENNQPNNSVENTESAEIIPAGNSTKRQAEINQIQTRFKNTAQVIKDDDESTVINVRFDPSDPDFAFKSKMSYLSLSLIVPKKYPHPNYPSTIVASIPDNCCIPEYSFRNLETGFLKYSQKMPNSSLLQKLNWLDRQCEALLKLPKPPSPVPRKGRSSLNRKNESEPVSELEEQMNELEIDEEEGLDELSGSGSDEFDYEYESSSAEDEEEEEDDQSDQKPFDRPLHRGIKAYFGHIELENISLVQIDSIGLLVRCNRCQTSVEIQPLMPNMSQQRSCTKCNIPMTIGLRPDIIHPSNFVLGYLDLQNCKAVDLTLCHFTPTCGKCDHQIQNPIFRKASLSIPLSSQCRHCFAKVHFEAQSLQFVQLGASILPQIQNQGGRRKKANKEALTIGQPLPKFGTCRHYTKSYRWFRFPCCGMLFPCDECHNSQSNCEDMERSRVMICGFCSKEQKYEQFAKCIDCTKTLASSTRGKTFWEGGKGARNTTKMNRNLIWGRIPRSTPDSLRLYPERNKVYCGKS